MITVEAWKRLLQYRKQPLFLVMIKGGLFICSMAVTDR
jgi:hypothetical protein